MKPEFELLVRCCGIARNLPVFGSRIQTTLPDGFNQDLFASMAIQHKTANTAMLGLKRLGIAINPVAYDRLKTVATRNRLVRGLILDSAYSIIELAGGNGIHAIILKGPASSKQLYNDAFIREYNDLDILVNLPNIAPMIPIMAKLGYVIQEYHHLKHIDIENSKLLQRDHHVVFIKEGYPFRVELHDRTGWERELFKRDNIDEVFNRAVKLEEAGLYFSSPDLPDHTTLILAHGTKHFWCLLHWVLDAAAFIAYGEENLHRTIAARVRALDMQRQLKLACDLVQKLFPINLPPAIEATIFNEPSLDFSVQCALDQLQVGGRDIKSFQNVHTLLKTKYSLPLMRKRKDKLKFLLAPFKIQPVDVESVPLSRRFMFLHLFLRPYFVLSRKLGKKLNVKARLHA